jgi:beta-N-acetylhexosaminidase
MIRRLRRVHRLRRFCPFRALVAIVLVVAVGVTAACSANQGARSPTPTVGASSPVATAGPTAGSTPSTEDSCIAATLKPMSMRQLVGQVMLVGTPLASPTDVTSLITSYGLGGVFLSGRSTAAASTLRASIDKLQAAAPPGTRLLIALDQEGGEVQTLKGSDFPPIPTAVAQGQLSQATLRSQTEAWAKRLAGIGVTLDLAPVADTVPTSIGTGNPPIGAFQREYGSDPVAVAADITTVVSAVQSTGVLTTLKHFPGLGRVSKNTDTSTSAVDSVATAQDPYLGPFQAGIKAGTAAVMVSSAFYPRLDPQTIAVYSSPIITGLLRQQLGFTGIVVSDDLGAAAAASIVPVGQRAVRFINAGGDLALTISIATAGPMLDGLLAEANASPAFAGKVTTAATRVLRAKYTAGLLPCSPRP